MYCVFCKIIKGELPSTKLYEDDKMLAFADINPQAPVHLLLVPKQHLESADAVTAASADLIAHIFSVVPKLAAEQGLTNGYRIVTNVGQDGAQSVQHLHFHLLGGRGLNSSMG